jgi:hypothetical protein
MTSHVERSLSTNKTIVELLRRRGANTIATRLRLALLFTIHRAPKYAKICFKRWRKMRRRASLEPEQMTFNYLIYFSI